MPGPRNPAGDLAEYQPLTATLGNLVGICPTCDAMIYRRVNRSKLERVRGRLEVSDTQASIRIAESPVPSVNSDSGEESDDDGDSQRE